MSNDTPRLDLARYIAEGVCVTLDKRLTANDLGDAVDALMAAGIPVRRRLVGDGELCRAGEYARIDTDAPGPRRQAWNYAHNFLAVVRDAADRGAGPILYLEDDASVVPGWESILPAALAELDRHAGDTWAAFWAGGNFINGAVELLGGHLLKPSYPLDLHALLLHPRAFPVLLGIQPSAHRTIDGVIGDMCKRGELAAYGCNPPVFYQRPGWSHNEQKFDNKLDRHLVRYVGVAGAGTGDGA